MSKPTPEQRATVPADLIEKLADDMAAALAALPEVADRVLRKGAAE